LAEYDRAMMRERDETERIARHAQIEAEIRYEKEVEA